MPSANQRTEMRPMSDLTTRFFRFLNRTSLVAQIIVGLIAGCAVALIFPPPRQNRWACSAICSFRP